MKNALGDRMKTFYESRTKVLLPRRTYTIIRIDGKAFGTYTKGLEEPFDDEFISDMNRTTCYLCKNIQGAKLGYVQSDEISLVLTDFDGLKTDAWFNGNIQKITSVSASFATGIFNSFRADTHGLAFFDSRVFTIPSYVEVINYLIWRQQDAVRNSISALSHSMYSDSELKYKNSSEQQDMCFQKGVNWNDLDAGKKRGRWIIKEKYKRGETTRTAWVAHAAPTFSQNKELLEDILPTHL